MNKYHQGKYNFILKDHNYCLSETRNSKIIILEVHTMKCLQIATSLFLFILISNKYCETVC